MMKKYLMPLMIAGALTAFTGCKDDISTGNNGGVENAYGEGAGYVSFTIQTDLSTRAEAVSGEDWDYDDDTDHTFNDGVAEEYALASNNKAHLAIFFDTDGNYYGSNNFEYNENNSGPNFDNTTAEQVYTYVSRYKNSNAMAADYALVILNCDPTVLSSIKNELESGMTLNKLLQYINTSLDGYYRDGDKTYFTMTSSTFFSENSNEKEGIKVGDNMTAKKIDSAQLQPTIEDALNNKITLYVERILAKHTLYFKGNSLNVENRFLDPEQIVDNNDVAVTPTIQYVVSYADNKEVEEDLDYPTFEAKTWKAYIVNWDMNALEPYTFLFKNMVTNSFMNTKPAYPWNEAISADWFTGNAATNLDAFFGSWNFDGLHRSYWAVDQHYLAGGNHNFGDTRATYFYPTQYRDWSLDPSPIDPAISVVEDGTPQITSLDYIPFNSIGKVGPNRYSLENTFADEEGHKGYRPLHYGTHFLIGAQLLVEGLDYANGATFADSNVDNENLYANADGEAAVDKWQAYGYWFSQKKHYIRYAFHNMAKSYANGTGRTLDGITYHFTDRTIYVGADKDHLTPITAYNADEYFTTAPASLVHGDGKVVIKPIKEADKFWCKDESYDETSSIITPVEITSELENIIYGFAEAAQHFANGRMYYAIPVQHLFGKSNNATAKVELTKTGEYNDIGQFGVVRNHWYFLNVEAVGAIGIPVDDPEQPIVPDPEDEYYIAFDIRILPWHKIDNGSVNLH